jgi:hypothetical protein
MFRELFLGAARRLPQGHLSMLYTCPTWVPDGEQAKCLT